jgi:hypothetical protein
MKDEKIKINHIKKILTQDYQYPEELIQIKFNEIEVKEFSDNFNSLPHLVVWNHEKTHRLIALTLDDKDFKFGKTYDHNYASIVCTFNEEISCWYKNNRISNLLDYAEIVDKSKNEIHNILNKKLFDSGFYDLPQIIFQIRDLLRSKFSINDHTKILMELFLIKLIDELEFKNKYFGYSNYENNDDKNIIEEQMNVDAQISIQSQINEILANSKISKNFLRHDFEITRNQNRYVVEQLFAILPTRSLLKSHISSIENSFLDIFEQMGKKSYIFSSRDLMKFVKHHQIVEKNKKILLDVDGHGLFSFFHILNEIREFCDYDDEKIREFVKSSLTVITKSEETFHLITFFKILNQFDCKIEHGDFEHVLLKEKYDVIFFNPPFGMKAYVKTTFGSDMGNHTIISMLEKLSENGIAIFTTLGGFLFRSNGGYGETRKHIIEKYEIKSIQCLPSGILTSTMVQPVLIKIKNNPKINKNKLIFFTNLENKIRKKIDLTILENTFEKVIEFEQNGKIKTPTKFGFTAKINEVIKNDYNLNPARYFDPTPSLIPENDRVIKLSDVVEIIRGTLPKKNTSDTKSNSIITPLNLIKLSDIENNTIDEYSLKKIPLYRNDKFNKNAILQENDIVFSIQGKIGKNALITKSDDKKIISAQLVILRPNVQKINPIYLQMCLNSERFEKQIKQFSTGSFVPRLSVMDLKNFWIPLKTISEQKDVSIELYSLQKTISDLKNELHHAENRLKNILNENEYDEKSIKWKQVK